MTQPESILRAKARPARVETAIANLQKAGVSFNVLCTLTNPVARHPRQVWKRLAELGIEYVQFTPCLAPLEGESLYTLTPRRFAAFYNGLFPLWLADYRAGRYRSVKLFDDVLNRLAYGTSGTCGMGGQCSPQIVVEADGSVYPCDFYCLEAYAPGQLCQSTLRNCWAAKNDRFSSPSHGNARPVRKLPLESLLRRRMPPDAPGGLLRPGRGLLRLPELPGHQRRCPAVSGGQRPPGKSS